MTKFWIDDWCALFSDFSLLPTNSMSLNEKLNALTRLVIVLSIVMYFMKYEYWLCFLILSVLIIFLIKYFDGKNRGKKEGFSIPPTYTCGSCPMTTIPPLFAEEKQLPPPAYDIIDAVGSVSPWDEAGCESQECLKDYSYPIFGQYITSTTMLPNEENEVRNRPLKDAQYYMTNSFTDNVLQFRNDMTRLFVNKINREYRGGNTGCYDSITPYSSW